MRNEKTKMKGQIKQTVLLFMMEQLILQPVLNEVVRKCFAAEITVTNVGDNY